MDSSSQDKISNFCGITGSTAQQANFFLESSNWDLDSAVSSFFDQDGQTDGGPQHAGNQMTDEDDNENSMGEEFESRPVAAAEGAQGGTGLSAPGSGPGGRARGGKGKAAANTRIKTFADLNSGGDDDEDDDEPNEYYTGGEKSGMMVQDPKKGSGRGGPVDVDSIFEQARRHGAREGSAEDVEEAAPRSRRRFGAFSGRARTLAGPSEEEEAEEEEEQKAPEAASREPSKPTKHTITFWRNGFTVDNGPLRRLDDPANANFLASINRGECPRELAPADRISPVEVNMIKKDEDWKPPPEPKYRAFSGTGRTLGGSAAEGEPQDTATAIATATGTSFAEPSIRPHGGLDVDESRPVTSVQIRLRDGTRMVARFNHHHTVADIRAFIEASRSGSFPSYQLQTMGFPPKQLTDPTATLEAAGLLNAVVMQR